jgi:peptidyl-prolyl cis-trans isomerase NIMA-interacting 1
MNDNYLERQQAEDIAAAAAAALSVVLHQTSPADEGIVVLEEQSVSINNSNNGTNAENSDGILPSKTPPPPLPAGWVVRLSRSQPPHHYYYYNQETGVSSWEAPFLLQENIDQEVVDHHSLPVVVKDEADEENERVTGVAAVPEATNDQSEMDDDSKSEHRHKKRPRRSLDNASSSSSSLEEGAATSGSGTRVKPAKVRVLHILRKHKDSRKPTSWRVNGPITMTKDEARVEMQGLLDLLRESQSDPEELRATMEELARTESDCSSYKRGGDLGFFEPKKMQPAFENAAFAMEIGELSRELVETSSGLHILLRIG